MPDTEQSTEQGPEPRRPMRTGRLAIWGLIAFALSIGGYLMLEHGPAPDTTQTATSAIGGPFTLTAHDGAPFTLKDLGGKPFAIYFGFTRCPDVCPTSLARLALLRQKLGTDGKKFAIVFVSVDPGHDTPAAVGDYVKLFGTPIIGLTGSEAQLKPVVKAYGAYVAKVPQPGGDYTIDHSTAVLLMNSHGDLADILGHDESEPNALAKLKALVGSTT